MTADGTVNGPGDGSPGPSTTLGGQPAGYRTRRVGGGLVDTKARSILKVLRPEATASQIARLTEDQWTELANRAGVARPSPVARSQVLAALTEREAT